MGALASPMPLAEAFGDLAWVRDVATGALLYMSPGAAEFYGISPQEIGFDAILAAIHPDDRARVRGLRVGMEGGITTVEYRYFRRGELRHAETRARLVLDAAGRPKHTEGIVTDVTARVRAEQEAVAQAQRARALVAVAQRLASRRDLASVGQLLCDELRSAIPVHGVALGLLDPSGEEFVTTAVSGEGVPPPMPSLSRARYDALVSHFGRFGHVPDVLAAADLAEDRAYFRSIGLRTFAYAPVARGERVVGLLVAATFGEPAELGGDALELMRAIAELGALAIENVELLDESRKVAERYRTIVETAAEGIVVVDPSYAVRFANTQFAAMLGYSVDEIVGGSAERFFFPEDLAERRTTYASRLAGQNRGPHRTRAVAKDGRTVHVMTNASPLFEDGRPAGLLVLVSDVTEALRLEEKVQQAQKLESLGVLAGGIAHDFNNLLVSILGNAGIALMDMPPDAPAREVVAEVQSAALRAAELTKQLLAYSGKGRFVVARLDVAKLVEDMVPLLTPLVGKGDVLEFHFARGLPAVEADAAQLRQLVVNLVTNSADALAGQHGKIRISTRLVHADRTFLAETYVDDGLEAGAYVAIEVADDGAGMSAATRARLFDPFFTTKFTGRGLGLAATLGILRAHKGAVKVDSEPGHGTKITVLLPAADAAPYDEHQPPTPSLAPEASGLVLVVDDEEGVRNVARRVLERAGFRVMTAVDGLAGVETFAAHADEIDLVLLDVTMPRMGGEAAFRELRRIRPEVPVILSSGFSEQEATSRFAGHGLAGFLEKPFSPRSLLTKVREALRS